MSALELIEMNNKELMTLIPEWESKLSNLQAEVITERRNSQDRNIKQNPLTHHNFVT